MTWRAVDDRLFRFLCHQAFPLLLLLLPLLALHAANLLSESTPLLRLRLALHLLRHLDVDLEELAHAAVQAHGLALVQVGFAVLGGDALLGAGVDEPVAKEERKKESVVFGRSGERMRSCGWCEGAGLTG